MKLPNSLTGPSNRGDDAPEPRPWRAHGCLPGIILIGWLLIMIIPLIGNELGFAVVLASPLGFTPVLEAMGLPKSLAMVGGIGVFVVLLSLPWFSFLASRISMTVVCTVAVIVLLLTHMSGCRKISSEMSKITLNAFQSQAQRVSAGIHNKPSMAQALQIANGDTLNTKLAPKDNLLDALLTSAKPEDRRTTLEDLFLGLMSSKEFLFNH